jgi:hypothetical protein
VVVRKDNTTFRPGPGLTAGWRGPVAGAAAAAAASLLAALLANLSVADD